MPNKKISQLDQITSVTGTEVVPVVQGGVVKRTTTGAVTGRLKELARAANATAIQDAKEVGRSTLIDGLSAGAVMQQDLKAVSGALHRSPNAVTAMFVYDTSKDSDGGAWTKRCQHTSWYNEPLSGNWLGAHSSELMARLNGAQFGNELITNGTFDTDTSGWGGTWYNGTMRFQNVSSTIGQAVYGSGTGKAYLISWSQKVLSGSRTRIRIRTATNSTDLNFQYWWGSQDVSVVVVSPDNGITFNILSEVADDFTVDNISIREIVSVNTTSNDYFQLTTDGKFYRLYKNLLQYSNSHENTYWTKNNITVSNTDSIQSGDGVKLSKISVSAASGTLSRQLYLSFQSAFGGTHTVSFYAKAAGLRYIHVGVAGLISGSSAVFDLQTGTLANTPTYTAGMQNLGNGVYRCYWTLSATTDISHAITFSDSPTVATTSVNDGASGVYVGGNQIEIGSLTSYENKTTATRVAEVFRGNKAEFPSLVGIVAEAGNVTLYDLTEPSMPMWMRFYGNYAASAYKFAANGQCSITSVCAMNGQFIVGQNWNNSVGGAYIANYSKDQLIQPYNKVSSAPISMRNTDAVGFSFWGSSSAANTVSASILPDAPVDSNSGLQAVTVAVATAGGISIIKNGTTVYNSTQTLSFDKVYLTPKVLIASRIGDSTLYYYPNPANISSNFTLLTEAAGAVDFNQGNTTALALENRSEFARSSGAKLQLLKHNETAVAKGAAATITPTYNTGYMVGDIKRSYLASAVAKTLSGTEFAGRSLFLDGTQGVWYDPSDITTLYRDAAGTTPVTGVEQPVGLMLDKSKGLMLGPELVTNGGFDVDANWAKTSATISGGVANISANGNVIQPNVVSTTQGVWYQYTATITTNNGVVIFYCGTASSGDTRFARSFIGTTGKVTFFLQSGGSVDGRVQIATTAIGSAVIDNISVRELPGNHAFNSSGNSEKFPVLSARYNLLTKTEDFSDAVWAKVLGATTPAPDTIVFTSSDGSRVESTFSQAKTGLSVVFSVVMSGTGTIALNISSADGTGGAAEQTFTLSSTPTRYSLLHTFGTVNSTSAGIRLMIIRRTGMTAITVTATKASLVTADQAGLPYQRVNTATDYDADATKFPKYLKFSGSQSLQTNSIDFSYTDKMFVSAGVRKLSDAARGMVVELGNNATNWFHLDAPSTAGTGSYSFKSQGSLLAIAEASSGYTTPITNVLSGIGNISGDQAILRINGAQVAISTSDQGAGNYGNYPLYIGARAGTSLFFNGQLSQLLIAGKAVTTKQIQDAENYIEQKTYGTYPEFLVDASGNQVVDALGNPLYANVTYQY